MPDISDLPIFRFHSDPLASESIVESDVECICCKTAGGYVYSGPCWGEGDVDLDDHLCPWCIADGAAHRKFGVTFTEEIQQWDSEEERYVPVQLPPELEAEILHRTPGFNTWQSGYWLSCCGTPAVFLGYAGKVELLGKWAGAYDAVLKETNYGPGENWNAWLENLEKDGSPSAYIFRCSQCQRFLAYSDCH